MLHVLDRFIFVRDGTRLVYFYQRNNALMSFLASNLVWVLSDFIRILITTCFHSQILFDKDNMYIYPKIYSVCFIGT